MKATVECISRYGYHNFSMQDVAKTAGVSKGIIHYYFLNKDDLMMSVLSEVAQEIELTIVEKLEPISKPKQKLIVFIEICLNVVREKREYYQVNMDFWTQINQKSEVKRAIAEHYEKFRTACASIIDEGISAGVFRKVKSDAYSSFIIATIDGLSLQCLFDSHLAEKSYKNEVEEFLLSGLIADEG